MSIFADSSALVKLYADEDGQEEIRALRDMIIGQIARVEVPAALWRKQRMGELAPEDAQILTAEFEADYFGTEEGAPRFAAVLITSEILEAAAGLCASHALRAYDGVQLSCAVAARAAEPGCTAVAAFDNSIRSAAAAAGFSLVPLATSSSLTT